jgi:hypothetical protein
MNKLVQPNYLTGLIPCALVSAFASTAVLAVTPSAKFAATWTEKPALASLAVINDSTVDKVVIDSKTGYTLATIKVPQDKELLVGVSAEIGLVTDTSFKGKNGGTATVSADAEAYVTIFAVPKAGATHAIAAPGQIILTKRVQALTGTLGDVIQSCTDADADGTTDIVTECLVTAEQIKLLQDTTAAHHFNSVLPNLFQGDYDIKAVFTAGARAEVDICTSAAECSLFDAQGTVSASSTAGAGINKTMLTVQ